MAKKVTKANKIHAKTSKATRPTRISINNTKPLKAEKQPETGMGSEDYTLDSIILE